MVRRPVAVACFWLCLLTAVGLGGLVAAAPSLAEARLKASPLLWLFARDATTRRAAVAGAVGLVGTAFVFFRPTGPRYGRVVRPDGSPPSRYDDDVGA